MRPDAATVRNLLDYDPSTGRLRWKMRPREMFGTLCACNTWNARYANKEAFTATRPNGYKVGQIFNKCYRTHHVVWLLYHGEWPREIDHINGNRADNRIANLRLVSRRENNRNQCRRRNNKSGCTGVRWCGKSWKVEIGVNYENIVVGSFPTFEEAVEARKRAEIEHGFHPNHDRLVRC